jgi:hypothetical protein
MNESESQIDEKSRLRQFWLRFLLTLGMLWGFVPLTTVLFVTRGVDDSAFTVFAVVCNALTIMPACLLAFWHRRAACVWLTVNAAIVLIAATSFLRRSDGHRPGIIVGVAVPVLLALYLDFVEVRHWPGALVRKQCSR